MAGLTLDFLAVKQGDSWQRAGRVQRIVGIKPEFFNRPDALHVSDRVMRELAFIFEAADPAFNYYGPTEFTGRSLQVLATALASGWKVRVDTVDVELADAVRALAKLVRSASDQGFALLALGI